MNKTDFKQKAKQTIDEIFNEIGQLEQKSGDVKADVRQSYQDRIKELKALRSDLQEKYEHIETASEEKWDEISAAFASGLKLFKKGGAKIASALK